VGGWEKFQEKKKTKQNKTGQGGNKIKTGKGAGRK